VSEVVVGAAADESHVAGCELDRCFWLVEPEPGLSADDRVDRELDRARQADPPRRARDRSSENAAGCACARQMLFEEIHHLRVSRIKWGV
jgi:hypothetical protein